MEFKEESEQYSNVEIYGAETMFNNAFNHGNQYLIDDDERFKVHEELFLCQGSLNSTSDANGHPLEIEGCKFSHCKIGLNGLPYAICYDEAESKHVFECTPNNGFYKVNA